MTTQMESVQADLVALGRFENDTRNRKRAEVPQNEESLNGPDRNVNEEW